MLVLLVSALSSACPSGSGYTSYDSKTCFKVYCAAENLADARAQCAADGGSLAVIQDADQNEAVRHLKEACGAPWVTIGLTSKGSSDDSCWHWSGYSSWTSYQNWDWGQPGKHDGDEECVAMGMHGQPGAGKWHDCSCDGLCMGTGALSFACRIDLAAKTLGSSACPGNCNAALEQGQCDSGLCTCFSGYKGTDCGCPESETCDTVRVNGVTSNCVERYREDPDHLPTCWVVPPYEARRVGGRWLYGLSGMPPQFAREADDNLVFLAALYVLTALVSAAGVWMAWRRRVRLVRVGVAYATKGFMRFTNALLVYYVLQLFVNLIALITFFSIRCGFHNVGASPGNVAARTLYQTSTMFGGVFTNAVLELVLLRKAQMMEGFAARGTGCNRCIAWLIWVQIILLLLGLPFGVISNVNLVSKGPEKAFDYDDSGSVEASEDPTVPFQATMALFGLVHVAASITLCVIFVQLLQLAQRRNRVLASEGSAPGPRVIRVDTSTQAPCTVTHRHLLSPI